jgi:hypothetical protein
LVIFAALFIGAAALMFGVGAIHQWIPAVPTIGYSDAFVVVTAGSILSWTSSFSASFGMLDE